MLADEVGTQPPVCPPPHLKLVNYINYLFILEFFSPHIRPHKLFKAAFFLASPSSFLLVGEPPEIIA